MKYKLSDICHYRKGKVDVSLLTDDTYISTENMIPNRGGITKAATLPTVDSTQLYKKGDILVSNIRPYFKKIWQATCDGGCSNDVLVFQANEGFDQDYLYYVLSDDAFFAYAMKTSKGTKMPRGDKHSIMQYETEVCDLATQRKIASLLKSIDCKIELNNAINNNLMQVASSLFSKALEDNADTLIATPLGEIADVKGGKRLPKGVNLQSVPNSHPYIRVRDLTNTAIVHINDDFEYVDDDTQRGISRYIVATNDVLLSIVGTIGLVSIVHPSLDNANLTENCVKLTKLKGITPQYLFLYLRSSDGQHEIARSSVGAVQAKLPIKNIQAINVPVLTSTQGKNLCETLNPLFSNMESLVAEIYSLTRLKNTLLPKLLSGEIDVSEVEF